MKLVFPITTASGAEFANQNEIETALKQETVGQFGFNRSNLSWHGGLHLTEKNAPWVKDKYPVRAIADGKVVACRISADYQTSTYKGVELKYSHDFCLIQHEFVPEGDDASGDSFTFYSLYMHLRPYQALDTIAPHGKQYKMLAQRNAREHPGLNGEKAYLKVGTILELDEGTEPQVINDLTFKHYTIVDNKGLSDRLAAIGHQVWVADKTSPALMEEYTPSSNNSVRPSWCIKRVEATTKATGLAVRSDPQGAEAGAVLGRINQPTKVQFDKNGLYGWYKVGTQSHLMARCTFPDGFASDHGVIPAGWMAVDEKYLDISSEVTYPLDTVNSFGNNSTLWVKAGDPIGYLGRYDTINSDSHTFFDTRYQIHFEQFATGQPTEGFLKAIFSEEDLEKLSIVVDKDSDGLMDPDAPPAFFNKLFEATSTSGDSTSEPTSSEVMNTLSTWDASKYAIIQHESEWYSKAPDKPIFDKLLQWFDDPEMPAILEHEKERVNKLVWMQEENKIGFGKHVWSWWPVVAIGKYTISIKQMEKLFPEATQVKRNEVMHLFNEYNEYFNVNTPERAAQFFAQIRAEVGINLEGQEEDLWYSVSALKSLFKRYFHDEYASEAEQLGYVRVTGEEYNKLPEYEKSKYPIKVGRKYYKQLPNEDEIAKRVYSCNSDNGYFKFVAGGDKSGIKYKGRGFIQLTWKGNYSEVKNIVESKTGMQNFDIIENPYLLKNTKEGFLSALGFWEMNKLNELSDNTTNGTLKITNKVNAHLPVEHKLKRNTYFTNAYEVLKND
jgi:predicted chitinase